MTNSFVCAFRGRRDSYQVPLALAEASLLDQFITDAYTTPWVQAVARCAPLAIRTKADFRRAAGIPPSRVSCLWGTTLLEHARHRLGCARALTFMKLDRRFSQVAARRAARYRSHLLLYSPYAWEAFVAKYPHTPRRILFQYHPHPQLEQQILSSDRRCYPDVGESFSGERSLPLPEKLTRRERDAWRHADLILCASRFTRRSLLDAGAEEKKCRVVPYGIDVHPVSGAPQPPPGAFHVIFVGSGGQRKGLHHLLYAWQRAALPADSKLTLICRTIDRGIQRLVAQTSGVELVRGVSQERLGMLYQSSTLFAMPSLVEGFGQVYLEALAQGCPVLGTENTCLPDLGDETDGIFLSPPAQVDQLAAKLEQLSVALPESAEVREAARACASRFSWPSFRDGVRRALGEDS